MSVLFPAKNLVANKGIGGKARNLLHLENMDIRVPRWVVIPQEVFLKQLPEFPAEEKLDEYFQKLVVPSDIPNQIARYFGSGYEHQCYAVRSSANDEDGHAFSFAGQFETFLQVPFAELDEKIKAIWQSAISERVRAYRTSHNLPFQPGIAVIVQEMIAPDVAGVAFGCDPVSGDPESKIISALYGLGEGLVSGDLDADTYTLAAGKITQQLATKSHAYVKNHNGIGIQKIKVEKDKQRLPVLTDNQLQEIVVLLDRLRSKLGTPQDIEFAYCEHQLYLLQTRPVTSKGIQKTEEYILWDNSNIIESYPGITTPLTFSFIKKMYAQVYKQLVSMMGLRAKEIEQHRDIFDNTLGLVRGRVYYNLLSWYKMLAMLPGYSLNAEFMEQMMGVKERFELKEDLRMSKGFARLRIGYLLIKMIALQINLPRQRKQFYKHLNHTIKQYKAISFNLLSPIEIIGHYKTFEDSLLLKWKAPMVNDFFSMIWFGLLKKQCQKYCPHEANIHNDLLCGSQDIISVQPIHQCIAISRQIQNDPKALALFKSQNPDDIWKHLECGFFPEIKTAMDQYLSHFGDRCVGELKLESIAYSQAPELFVKVIQSYIQQGITQKRKQIHLEEALRKTAEQKVFHALKRKAIQRWWFKYILQKTRDLVSNRENLRYERTRGFGMVRSMFTALGEKLYQAGHLDDPRAVFYLELSEIKALEKTPFSQELKAKIEARKAEFAAYQKQEAPRERFYTYGHHFTDEYIYSDEKREPERAVLSGIGCCPGRVQGRVRVVKNPDEIDSLNGDILVTSSTDPGWVILFPTAAAIIVERGSLLSHSAIVSREMGIPCIVSVSGLLRSLKTGDEVLMDGSTGKIKIFQA